MSEWGQTRGKEGKCGWRPGPAGIEGGEMQLPSPVQPHSTLNSSQAPQRNLGSPVSLLEPRFGTSTACWALRAPPLQGMIPGTPARPPSHAIAPSPPPTSGLWKPQVSVSVRNDLVFSSVPWLAWPQCQGDLSWGGCRTLWGYVRRAPHIISGCLELIARRCCSPHHLQSGGPDHLLWTARSAPLSCHVHSRVSCPSLLL